jgi:hypothetical protein
MLGSSQKWPEVSLARRAKLKVRIGEKWTVFPLRMRLFGLSISDHSKSGFHF